MTPPSVTFTGEEVALIAGCIISALPHLDAADQIVLDLMLDRAVSALGTPLSPALAALIERRRKGVP